MVAPGSLIKAISPYRLLPPRGSDIVVTAVPPWRRSRSGPAPPRGWCAVVVATRRRSWRKPFFSTTARILVVTTRIRLRVSTARSRSSAAIAIRHCLSASLTRMKDRPVNPSAQFSRTPTPAAKVQTVVARIWELNSPISLRASTAIVSKSVSAARRPTPCWPIPAR